MAAYCLFDVRKVKDPEKLGHYRGAVLATVEKYGGRYLLLGGRVDALEGSWRPTVPVLIRFPDLETAQRWYGSPEYAPLKALRLSATEGDAVLMQSETSEFVAG